MKHLHEITNVAVGIANATILADNTPAAVDLAGYRGAEIILAIGAGGITFTTTNKVEFKLTHSDDDSTYTAVAQSEVLGTTVGTGGIIKSLNAAHATASVYRVGYVGSKRYLKLLADFSGTHGTGTPIAAIVVRGYPGHSPAPDQV